MLDAIAAGKASARLLQDRAVELRLVATGLPEVTERIDALRSGLPPADVRLNELLEARRTGYAASGHDSAAGAKAFETHCAACHQIGGKGAKVGPQLDGVGVRGLDRLLEDILDPNRNVDQAFRTTQLALKDGQLVSGLLLREEGAVLVLADAQGKEVRVPEEMSRNGRSRTARRCPPTSRTASPSRSSISCSATCWTNAPPGPPRPRPRVRESEALLYRGQRGRMLMS